MQPQIRYARTSDGVSIAYYTMGSGVPLVAINLPVSNLQHELATPRIRAAQEQTAREAMLVRYDHRGMARSSAGVAFDDRGEQEMKGVGEPVRVYAVRGVG